jgi:small subunit ribosomal protein S1
MHDKNYDNFFDENKQEEQASSQLLEMIDGCDKKIRIEVPAGSKVTGTVSRIGSEFVFVDIGGRNEAMIKAHELFNEDGVLTVAVGDKFNAFVVSTTGDETILSKSMGGQSMPVEDLFDALNNGIPVQGKVTGVGVGGLTVKVLGHRAFCPISQIDIKFTDDVNVFLGKNLDFVITRITEGGRNVVLSRIPLLEQTLGVKFDDLEKVTTDRKMLRGKISKIAEFGLFVDIGGVEGLVHISEVSWERAEKLEESFNVGQEVEVIILKIEKKQPLRSSKISLSIKQVLDNPWDSVGSRFKIGELVQGKITRITNFGAFVELIPGVEGLVHVSEMSWLKRVHHPSEIVQEGNLVQVSILGIDETKKSISLSLKDISDDPWRDVDSRFPAGTEIPGKVSKKSRYGYFIDITEGVTGLLVFANIASDKKESFNEGDTINVMVDSIDRANRRISLSYGVKESKQIEKEIVDYLKNQKKKQPAEQQSSSTDFGAALFAALKSKQ